MGDAHFLWQGQHAASSLKSYIHWPLKTTQPPSQMQVELKIDWPIWAKKDYYIYEWDVWEHHLQHTQCAAHVVADCSELAQENKSFGFGFTWNAVISFLFLFQAMMQSWCSNRGFFTEEAIVFVKELDSSVGVKSLPVSVAVGWHHCLVWDYSFSVAKPSMVKSQTVWVTRERLEASQTCSHTNTMEKGRGSSNRATVG